MSADAEVESTFMTLRRITFRNHFKKKFYLKQDTLAALWQPGSLGLPGAVATQSSAGKGLGRTQVPHCFPNTHHHSLMDEHADALAQREPGSREGRLASVLQTMAT